MFILILCAQVIASCQSNTEKDTTLPTEADTGSKEKQAATAQDFKLTEENAEEFLREYGKKHPANTALIHTRLGDIKIRLYQDTPLHRANFLYLAGVRIILMIPGFTA